MELGAEQDAEQGAVQSADQLAEMLEARVMQISWSCEARRVRAAEKLEARIEARLERKAGGPQRGPPGPRCGKAGGPHRGIER